MSDRPPASASSWGLNDEWLNDAAKAYVPVFKEPEWRLVKTVESLSIHLADARSMLAMKIRASRGHRDEADLRVLMLKCGITSEEEAVALFDAKPAGTALFLSGESLRHLHLLQSATTDVVYSPKRCDDRLNPPVHSNSYHLRSSPIRSMRLEKAQLDRPLNQSATLLKA